MKSFGTALLLAGALGVAVPLCCWLACRWTHLFPTWTVYIWPSSIFLMATDGHECEPISCLVAAISVGANAALYGIIGMTGYWIFRRIADARDAEPAD